MRLRIAGIAVLLVLLLAAAPGAHAAPLWTFSPASPWTCWSSRNDCVAGTGFKPTRPNWGADVNPRGNCTNYAAYRLSRNGARQPASPMGDAAAWAATVRRTLGARHVNGTPAVGAIAWWDGSGSHGANGHGHVAYVEKVVGRTIYLSASSWPFSATDVASRRSTVTQGSADWPVGFLHIKDAPAGASPIGHLDRVAGLTGGRVQVAGWAFDPDAPASPVRIQVWIDGKPGTAGAVRVDVGWASESRPDVARVHPSAGPHHGFSQAIPHVRSGSHAIRVYALNRTRGGSTTYLGGRTVRVPSTTDEGSTGGGSTGPGTSHPSGPGDTTGAYFPWDGTFHLSDTPASGPSDYAFEKGTTVNGEHSVPVVGDWNGSH